MMESGQMRENENYFDSDIDLREIYNVLKMTRKLIFKIITIFAILSTAYSLILTDYYKSEALLLARSSSETQGGLSQYSGLAAIAGLSLPSTGEDKAAQTIELIKSRNFVRHLLTFDDILPSIMAAKSYDRDSKEILFDQKLYNSESKTWNRKPINNRIIPSYLEAHEHYIENMLSIYKDDETGFISIHIEHISPIFAKNFLDLIIQETNELLRRKDMEESMQGLEYLTSELSKTPFIEMKESINALIESQLETQMMTKINQDYILKEIEPPFIPEEASRPNRILIIILSTILGGLLSLFFVLIRHYYFSGEEQ